jgi:hypothetical protein
MLAVLIVLGITFSANKKLKIMVIMEWEMGNGKC